MSRGVQFFRASQADAWPLHNLPYAPEPIDLDAIPLLAGPGQGPRLKRFLQFFKQLPSGQSWVEALFLAPEGLPSFESLFQSREGRALIEQAADALPAPRTSLFKKFAALESAYKSIAAWKDSDLCSSSPRYVASIGPELWLPSDTSVKLVLLWNAGFTKLLESETLYFGADPQATSSQPSNAGERTLAGSWTAMQLELLKQALERAGAIIVNSRLDAEFVLHHGSSRERVLGALEQDAESELLAANIPRPPKPLFEKWNAHGKHEQALSIGIWGDFLPENAIRPLLLGLGNFRETKEDFAISFFVDPSAVPPPAASQSTPDSAAPGPAESNAAAYKHDCQFIIDSLGLGDYLRICGQDDFESLRTCHFMLFGELLPQATLRMRPAMAAGCIVLAADLPWNRPPLRHDARRLFTPYSPDSLASALRYFAQNPDLAQALVNEQLQDLNMQSIRSAAGGLGAAAPLLPSAGPLPRDTLRRALEALGVLEASAVPEELPE